MPTPADNQQLAALIKRNSDLATLISQLQSRVDTLDSANSLRLILNDGVYNNTFNVTNSGMSLTVSATGTYTAGNYSEAIVNGRYIKVDDTQNFYTLQNGDSTYDRIDIVYIGRFGIGVVQGTPATTPTEPDLPANTMAIYKITVPANETDGTGLTITDVRVALTGLATLELNKADKVSGATAGNLAGLDADGNLTDSGKSPSDFEVAGAVATHESTYDHTQLHTHTNKATLDLITDAGSGQIITAAERTALGNKADKTIPAADGNLAALDGTTGNLVDSGKSPSDFANATHTHLVADITDFDPTTKADKVSGATAGNLAELDASGNLVDSGVNVQATNLTINFTNLTTDAWNDTGLTDLAQAIQAKIDAIPKMLANNCAITLQFADGTYTLSQPITLSQFFGSGKIYVYGNSADFDLTTTKSVVLDFSGQECNGIVVQYTKIPIYIQGIHIKYNSATANYRGIDIDSCDNTVYPQYNILENIDTTLTYGYGVRCLNGAKARIYKCYFTAGFVGVLSQFNAMCWISNCDELTTAPKYGVYSNGAIIFNSIAVTQINGSTSDTVAVGGGQVWS